MDAEIDVARRPGAIPERAAVILGNDALVAARPSTPAQLASACVLAGFDIIIPPSLGDEIIASAYLARFAGCSDPAIVACACPRVRECVRESPAAARLPCVAVASPPVAAARYLRATLSERLLITYVGDCPAAADPAIDARFSPAGFLASLHRQGISLADQPTADRHHIGWARHRSTPGGLPARRFVAKAPIERVVREALVTELAHGLPVSRSAIVIDVVGAGCVCSGVRDEVTELEPARSSIPLVEIPANLDTTPAASAPRSRASLRARDGLTTETPSAVPAVPAAGPAEATASLDRAPRVRSQRPVTIAEERKARSAEVVPARPSPLLILLAIAVLAGATALGVGAYAAASGASRRLSADTSISTPGAVHADTIGGALPDSGLRRSAPSASPYDTAGQQRAVGADSARAGARVDSSRVAADSARGPRRRPRRARPAEIMPGWLPQGQPSWSPDSQPARRPDSAAAPPPRRPPA